MVRPKNIRKTTQKTYMLYEEDIEELNKSSRDAKYIFHLGMLAHLNGWSPAKDNKEVEELRQRILAISTKLQLYVDKFNKLALIVEKALNKKIDVDTMTSKELEEKLKQISKLEKKIKNE